MSHFFEMGPATKDGPLEMRDVLKWGEALGVEWKPWQSRLLVRLSREYCVAQQEATKFDAPPPWPGAVKMWGWVRAQQLDIRARAMMKQEI